MKADIEAMKGQMTTRMEAIICMRNVMEVNRATVIATSTTTEVDPTHPSGLNQVNPPASDTVGQGGKALGSAGDPHYCKSRASIPSQHMSCLPTVHHPVLHMLLMRMLTTSHLYPLRANNPNLIMHMSLNPWGNS